MIAYHRICSQDGVTNGHQEAPCSVNVVGMAGVTRRSRHQVGCRFAQGNSAVVAVRTLSRRNGTVGVGGGGNEAGYTAMANPAVRRNRNRMGIDDGIFVRNRRAALKCWQCTQVATITTNCG